MRTWLPTILSAASRVVVIPVLAACIAFPATFDADVSRPAVERPAVTIPTLDHDRFPGCFEDAPARTIPADSVVVTQGGAMVRIGFDQAWALNANDERADDVWVVGVCL